MGSGVARVEWSGEWSAIRAPVIRVRGGSPQIPDAVLYSCNTCWVVDASVVADNADLDNACFHVIIICFTAKSKQCPAHNIS